MCFVFTDLQRSQRCTFAPIIIFTYEILDSEASGVFELKSRFKYGAWMFVCNLCMVVTLVVVLWLHHSVGVAWNKAICHKILLASCFLFILCLC